MTAHLPSATYLVVMERAAAEEHMSKNNKKMLNQYLEEAPPASILNTKNGGTHVKYHRNTFTENKNDRLGVASGFYQKEVVVGNQNYLERPSSFWGVSVGYNPDPADVHMWQFKDEQLDDDKAAQYHNDAFPWILAVYKYAHISSEPTSPDVSLVKIPEGSAPGDYIIQYSWNGYRDCVDVRLVDYQMDPVFIYGNRTSSAMWRRIDHCSFPTPKRVWTSCTEVVVDAKYCIERCEARSIAQCSGVQVTPVKAPANVYAKFRDESDIPWNSATCNVTIDDALAAPEDTYICYALDPREFKTFHPPHVITNDQDDPRFYSTCYVRSDVISFGDGSPPVVPQTSVPAEWRFGQECVSCQEKADNEQITRYPIWNLKQQDCVNCDAFPATPKDYAIPEKVYQIESRCDGIDGGWSYPDANTCANTTTAECQIKYTLIGRTVPKLNECLLLASQDPMCSGKVSYRENIYAGGCYCHSKESCCGSCQIKNWGSWKIYDIPVPS